MANQILQIIPETKDVFVVMLEDGPYPKRRYRVKAWALTKESNGGCYIDPVILDETGGMIVIDTSEVDHFEEANPPCHS